ncbi:hypothetical protein [Mycetocola spongiae]|uniref:hypothetical protein n=1 Tax=Mycetocola spongiae TaxID=2859226 RepID=UPI001CF2EBF0|nr:hypothetical protein [Mycetocola spongiae]UCR90337.1 hypothetical protein KXZ72_06725 [Mycetocola spongiae]
MVLGATAIAGLLGYVIQVGMGAALGDTPKYTIFMAFWAAFYLIIGALAGIQQEFARAFSRIDAEPAVGTVGVRPQNFLFGLAGTLLVVLVGSGFFWGPLVFGQDGQIAAAVIAVGAAAYVIFSGLSGQLYGQERWGVLAVAIIADPLLRAVLLGAVVLIGGGILDLQLAVTIPVALTTIAVALLMVRRRRPATRMGMSARALTWNCSRTVAGSVSTAALISGFPLFLKLVGENDPALATIIFVFTVVRAPVVIPLLALQNFMIVHFSKNAQDRFARVIKLILVVVLGAVFLGVVAMIIGPALVQWVTGGAFLPDPLLVGGMVAAAGLTAALCVSGAAVLAADLHGTFAAGWTVAAVVSIGLLLIPGQLSTVALVALTVGPLPGLACHLFVLRRNSAAPSPSAAETGAALGS